MTSESIPKNIFEEMRALHKNETWEVLHNIHIKPESYKLDLLGKSIV